MNQAIDSGVKDRLAPELPHKRRVRMALHGPHDGWRRIEGADHHAAWRHDERRINVICSAAIEEDDRAWLHVSLTKHAPGGGWLMPSYEDICDVKREFIGDDFRAIEIHASAAVHVNIHGTCRHLWACLENDGLPEFSVVLPNGLRTI